MRTQTLLTSILALAVAGCGASSASSRGGPAFEGRTDGPPSMQSLPDPGVDQAELTAHMRTGWSLAAEAFDVRPPEPPDAHDVATLEVWSRGALRQWLEAKTRQVDEARRELDAAAEESHPQRVMGGAIVGLMYEDIVRVLLEIPTPTELLDDPDIADAYQDIVQFQASTYLEQARRAYRACTGNAEQLEEMQSWAGFCSGRRRGLPAPRSAASTDASSSADASSSGGSSDDLSSDGS